MKRISNASHQHPRGSVLRRFLSSEAAGGVALLAAAALALIAANGPFAAHYFELLHAQIGPLSLLHWINDGLMAVFFLLVGLEIKRELVDGHLATWSDRVLPVIAAAAGMMLPALIYLAVTAGMPGLGRGWAIPAATDIAFALGILALLGPRVPGSLKLLLTTIAIVDDMGAVAIIAFAYTAKLNLVALAAAGAILVLLVVLNRRGETRLAWYLPLAAALWLATLASGVHATVAGVLAAMTIPVRSKGRPSDAEDAPLHRLERWLQPWVAFAIVPVFGFANAGVRLWGVGLPDVLHPLPLGIALGLFAGKQLGIFLSIRAAVAAGLASRPSGASWPQVYGMALLCGIGFTMSLFIGGLAFLDPVLIDRVKIGVLAGSALSAAAGYLLLRSTVRRQPLPTPGS